MFYEDIKTAILKHFEKDDVNETPTGFPIEEYSHACSYCSDYNFFKGRKLRNRKKCFDKLKKNLLLQNHQANFNQTYHKASLGKGDSSLFK